jgi:uncharacterized protein (DUF1501 family)
MRQAILHPTRRGFLGTGAALAAWAYMPRAASAAGRDPRFVTIVLRGALDGLSAVAPVGDPDYAALRESIALSTSGDRPAIPLDGFFALHPAMPEFARLYKAGSALVVHATATPYRDRSHFDGQDVLESGQPGPGMTDTGWLNRVLSALPRGERVATPGGLGVGAVTPLVMRGPAKVLGWAPDSLKKADDDTARRVLALYQHADPPLADALSLGLRTGEMASGMGAGAKPAGMATAEGMRSASAGAAALLARDDGPRVAALAFDGWDTHAEEGVASGRLAQLLAGLDGAIATFERTLGPAWGETVILVITEFGRTARVNGTVGTDHGTATVAFLAGGAVKGGRVVADWPGLKPAALFEERDLAPTRDLRTVIKGVLADHLGLSQTVLGHSVFPETADLPPLPGLIV